MSRNKWLLPLGFSIFTLLFSFNAISAETTSVRKIDSDSCMKCHKGKRNNGKMMGRHGADDLKIKMTCSSCHGKKGSHPRKPNDLVVFGAGEDASSAEMQFKACRKCHSPKKLAKDDWTHNVHAQKVPCGSCHKLHSADEPMQALSTQKERSDLCRDCHSVEEK